MAEIIDYNLMKQYAPSGTHMGSALATGSGHLSGVNNASYQGVQSSDYMFESFMPTEDNNAFNIAAQPSLAGGASKFLSLNNVSFVTTAPNPYLIKVNIDQTQAVKLDYPRSFEITSTQAFTVIVSGYDRYLQKCCMRGTSSLISGTQRYQMVRCLAYVTSIYVTNTTGTAATYQVNMNKTFECPFWSLPTSTTASQYSAVYQLLDLRAFTATEQRSLMWTQTQNSPMGFGTVFATNSIPNITTNSPGQPMTQPLTLTTGTPRTFFAIASTSSIYSYFPFDQATMYTMYFAATSLFTNSEPTWQYNFDEKISLIGPTNYFDSNWSGWQG